MKCVRTSCTVWMPTVWLLLRSHWIMSYNWRQRDELSLRNKQWFSRSQGYPEKWTHETLVEFHFNVGQKCIILNSAKVCRCRKNRNLNHTITGAEGRKKYMLCLFNTLCVCVCVVLVNPTLWEEIETFISDLQVYGYFYFSNLFLITLKY